MSAPHHPRSAARQPAGDDDRRSFTSRTPATENPDRAGYRRGFVTRHQVSGWRFMMRRIASGVALHDTRMLVDPLRTQSRALLVGALVLVTGLAGCFVFSLIRPSGSAGTDAILADRSTAALYVRLGDRLHPVLNLTSARLIAGRADNPTTVRTDELDQFPRGNLVGIPGAPERLAQNSSPDADWTVCDAASGVSPGVTVIAGPLGIGGERATPLADDRGVLVAAESGTWLLWQGRRSAVDLANRPVTDALGIGALDVTPRPIAAGLFNAIPEAPALVSPAIPDAGAPPRFPLPVPAPVGAVVSAFDADTTVRYYAVLPDGLQPIPQVLAAVLRNTNSYGLAQPPRLAADDIARLPVADTLDVDAYPADRITLVDPSTDPVTCARWSKAAAAEQSSLSVLSGAALPLPAGMATLGLVGGGNGVTADRVALAPGRGYLVQTVGQEPGSPTAGSLFWVSDTGVRYGIESSDRDDTVTALGLTGAPSPVPWSVLAQFAAGPTLSRADALLAHDTLSPDPNPARLENR